MNGKWGPKDMISQEALTPQGMHCFLLDNTHKANLVSNRTRGGTQLQGPADLDRTRMAGKVKQEEQLRRSWPSQLTSWPSPGFLCLPGGRRMPAAGQT